MLFSLMLKVPICAAGEIDPTHYVDPKSGQSYALDHLTMVCKVT